MRVDDLTLGDVTEAVNLPPNAWGSLCHGVSLAIVQAGVLPGSRVARGRATGVLSQHSWVVNGPDCYDPDAEILDPTIWNYQNEEPYLWTGTLRDMVHFPHGQGVIWSYGCPESGGGEPIELAVEVSGDAQDFLELAGRGSGGPRDWKFWMGLLNAPVEGWPAAEIHAAAFQTPQLRAMAPIDFVGMLTDLNPNGLYLPGDEVTP